MYANNLVFVENNLKKVEEKYGKRKKASKSKELKVNFNKTKAKAMQIEAESPSEVTNDAVNTCGISDKRMMMMNLIQSQKSEYWIQKDVRISKEI